MQKQKRLSIEELKASAGIAIINQSLEALKGGLKAAAQCHLSVSGDGKTLMDDCTGKPFDASKW